MRLPVLIIFFFFLLTLTVKGQNPPYWFHFAGSIGNDEGMAITTDNANNVINVGYFSLTINFGSTYITSSGVTDGYIVKTANDGTYAWALKFGGSSDDRPLGVCTDAANNIYVTGYFSGTANFGSIALSSSGLQDAFIMKIDPGGNILWVRQCGGSGNDIGNGICADNNGNVIVTGQFRETAQFGSNSLTSMNDPITGVPSTDIFTTKLDGNGVFLWAKKGSAKYTDRGIDVSCDPSGNIFVTGQFSDTITFDIVHTNSMFNAIFIIKYNPSGNEQWFNKIGAGTTTVVRSIKVDQNSDLYISGDCSIGTIFFGTPNITITNPFPNRVFAAKYNSSGAIQWATAIGTDNAIAAGDMAIDDSSNVYITGTFNCKLSQFSDYYGQGIFNSIGYKDIFTSRISNSGVFEWARQCGGPANDAATGIELIGNSPVITGSFNNRFIYPSSPLYLHYEDAFNPVSGASMAPFCQDLLQGNFYQDSSLGESDIYFGKAYDLARMPYDYYNRTNSNCTLPFVGVGIALAGSNNMPSVDTTSTCTERHLYAATNTSATGVTDTINGPGPTYNYLWNTGETTPDIFASTAGNYSVTITSIDGCFTSTDSIFLIHFTNPPQPLISDNFQINTNAQNTTPLLICAPDTIILTASNIGNNTVHWSSGVSTFPNDSTTTLIVQNSGVITAIVQVTDSNQCISTNSILLFVSTPLDSILPVLYVPEDTIQLCYGENFTLIPRIYDSIADPLNMNGCMMDNAFFNWISVPFLNIITGCNNGQTASVILNQPGSFLLTCIVNRSSNCGGSDVTVLSQLITVLMYPPVILTPPLISLIGNDTLCPGSSTILTASGGNYFTWTGPNVPSGTTGPNLTVYDPGYYCVKIYDTSAVGCITTAANCQNMYMTSPPQIITIPGNNVICPNDSVQLISTSAGTYEWVGPLGVFSTNDTAYANIPGNYYCNVTDLAGCKLSTATIELIQYTTPGITVTPSNMLCQGDSIQAQVFASPYANIYWYEPFNNSNPIQYIDSAGIYVCFTESCNIYREDTIIIYSSNLTATINPSGTVSLCDNDTLTLTGNSGMALYEWIPGNNYTDSIYVNQSGNYYLIVTDQYGCRDTSDTVSVNTLIAPSPPIISGNTPLCEGDSLGLSTAFVAGVTYNWTGPANFTATTTNTGISNISTSNSGNYFLTISNTQCTSLPDSIFIQVDSLPPTFNFVGDTLHCEGNDLLLSTSPSFGNAGFWSIAGSQIATGSVFQLTNVTTLQSGQYVYTINNALCTREDSVNIVVDSLPPNFTLNGSNAICEGEFFTLSTTPVFGNQGYWITPGQQTINGSVFTISSAVPGDSGYYFYTLTNQHCFRTDSILMQVNSYPSPFTINGNTILCEGDQLSLATNPGFGNQGIWILPNNQQMTGSAINISGIDLNNSGYYLYIISNQQCAREDSVDVQVIALPTAFSINAPESVCIGEPLSISTTPNFGNQGYWILPNGQQYTGSNYNLIASSSADSGSYIYSINNQQCIRRDSIIIQVNSYPDDFIIEGNLSVCNGEALTLNTSPDFGNQGSWYLPNNLTATGSIYSIQQTDSGNAGNYYYTIRNQQCSRTDSVQVMIVSCNNFFPNVFTPNNDGINDFFNALNADINIQSIKIFNRWGENIAEITSGKGWDGKNSNGLQAPSGTYFYIANYLEGSNQIQKRITGQVELIR